jgi:uncharacterized protein (TIGR02284 family)
MQATDEHAVKVLNSLIETTLDSANGYRDAADTTENPKFKSMFSERAERRRQLSHQLQEEVRSFGGEPKDDQSMLGKAHNKFTELKGKITGSNDKRVIDEVERGEDVIRNKFEQATREEDLPDQVRRMVSSAFASIKADHDDISRLKHQMH